MAENSVSETLAMINARLTKIETMMEANKEHDTTKMHDSRIAKMEIDLAVLKNKITLYGAGAGFLVSLTFSAILKIVA